VYDGSVQLLPVQDHAGLTHWHDIASATRAHDHTALPADPIEELAPLLDPATPHGGERRELHLGCADGTPVGAVQLHVPVVDNLSSCSVDVLIPPQERRRGHGRALLAEALEAVASLGRTRVFFEVPSPYPDGPVIAAGMLAEVGARPVLREVRRLLDLASVPAMTPPPPPAGYRLVQWVDRVPDELVDDMAYLMHRMSTDVPLGDMDWEPELWDAARYRAKEAAAITQGRTRVATLAVSEETGRAAGFTDIGVSRFAPETAYQWETLVDREHRGHGLGLVLKAHNHRLLAERSPQTRWLNTWNAETNTHMVAINEQLGFQPVEYWTEWQLDRA
jgi:GNAT superfamily N-acetyltransferase